MSIFFSFGSIGLNDRTSEYRYKTSAITGAISLMKENDKRLVIDIQYFFRSFIMTYFKKIICSATVTAMAVLIMSCGGSDSSSDTPGGGTGATVKNLPSSLSVSIPKTLGTSGVGKSSELFRASVVSKAVIPTSFAYNNVNTSIFMMKMQMASMAMNMVVLDRIIDGLTPSDTPVTGRTITFTQEMQDMMLSLMPESERDNMGDESFVGRTIDLGSFVYKSVNEDGYNFKYSETTEGGGSFTVYWSSDKNKLKVVSVSAGYTYAIVRNISDKSAKMYSIINLSASASPTGQAQNSTAIISLKEIEGSTKHGVCLSDAYINIESDKVTSYSFEGVADDDGGYITNQYLSLYNAAAVPSKMTYAEGFDSTGALTFQQNGAIVVYGAESAAYKTLFTDSMTGIKSMQGTSNNDQAILGSSANTLFKDASWATDGDTYIVLDSNSGAVTAAISGYNTDPSNASTYTGILDPHVIGVAIAEKDGAVSIYVSNRTVYTAASSLYLVKVDFVPLTALGTTLQTLAK